MFQFEEVFFQPRNHLLYQIYLWVSICKIQCVNNDILPYLYDTTCKQFCQRRCFIKVGSHLVIILELTMSYGGKTPFIWTQNLSQLCYFMIFGQVSKSLLYKIQYFLQNWHASDQQNQTSCRRFLWSLSKWCTVHTFNSTFNKK